MAAGHPLQAPLEELPSLDDGSAMDDQAMDESDFAPLPTQSAAYKRRPALHGAENFVSWTWEMVNAGHAEIGWSADGTRVIVDNPERLAKNIFPLYFNHANYDSWVRPMNAHDFKKVPGCITPTYEHPNFQRGRPENLKHIRRKSKKPAAAGPSTAARPVAARPSAASTQLVAAPSRALQRSVLEGEKARLRWLEQQLGQLEDEAHDIRDEDLRQKIQVLQYAQFVMRMRGGVWPVDNPAGPRLHLNPEVLGTPAAASPGARRPMLTCRHEGNPAGGSSFAWGAHDGCGDAASLMDVEPARKRHRSDSSLDTAEMVPAAAMGAPGAPPPAAPPPLPLVERELSSGMLGALAALPSLPSPSSLRSLRSPDADAALELSARMEHDPFRLDEDALLDLLPSAPSSPRSPSSPSEATGAPAVPQLPLMLPGAPSFGLGGGNGGGVSGGSPGSASENITLPPLHLPAGRV